MPPENDALLPIHVGKKLSTLDLHIQTDCDVNGQECDNISDKNDSYCELTAMYWAWKNIKKIYPNIKYIGLFHYRRFLAFDRHSPLDEYIEKFESDIKNYVITSEVRESIKNILEDNKVIMPVCAHCACSMRMQYIKGHVREDYEILENIIKNNFNDYYPYFKNFMEHNKVSCANMFVMKYDDFVNYCEWLFSVLAIVEKNIDINNRDTYQKRVFGFMAERLFNIWVLKNKNISYCGKYQFVADDTQVKKSSILKKLLLMAKFDLAFNIRRTKIGRKIIKILFNKDTI